MLCRLCDRPIALTDMANELPDADTLVHEACYARETGHAPAVRLTLADHLRPLKDAA